MATAIASGVTARARQYRGAALKEIAFPPGGIGTGTVSLGGRGQLRDWEIFNRPAKGRDLPLCFFAIRAQPEGQEAVARVLERRLLPPFVADRGLSPWAVASLPRLEEATFTGSYPLAAVRFHDRVLPVEVELEAFTPFAPFDDRVSGLPVAVFLWRVRNPSDRPVEVTLAYTQLNPVGYDGVEILRRGRRHPTFGGNLNQWTDQGPVRGLRMSRPGFDTGHPGAGTVAVATAWPQVTFSEHWERSGWFDDIQSFWDDFRADGRLPDRAEGTESPPGETDAGTLGLIARLAPGQAVELPIVLAWHFPNLVNYWGSFETLEGQSVAGQRMTNWYATQWPDAWAAARETLERLDELTAKTRAFRDALFASTLPEEVLDAVSSQLSILRTLIWEGEVEAGLEIVRGVRGRHDGIRRNPWDEFECGHHYARALSSWALLLALSGYRYSAPAGRLGFAPQVAGDDFRCFFTAGTAWGTVEITARGATLSVQAGELRLAELALGDRLHSFEAPVVVRPGQPLVLPEPRREAR